MGERALGGLALVEPAAVELVRVRLDLAYDGTNFSGWAAQTDRRTVHGVIADALQVLIRDPEPPKLTVAGRTDAGVHARGQVAHIDLRPELAHDPLLLRKLNGLLPADVRIRSAAPAAPGFDARFAAMSRTYRYRVFDGPAFLDPLRRYDVLTWPRPLDEAAMSAACPALLGEHDFAAFCKRRDNATTIRALLALDWVRQSDGLLVMTIQADAFCHSMVRSLVGAFLAVGEGRKDAAWPGSLLSLPGRASNVLVAPPHGLVLEAVAYPPDAELAARQNVTRNRRG